MQTFFYLTIEYLTLQIRAICYHIPVPRCEGQAQVGAKALHLRTFDKYTN